MKVNNLENTIPDACNLVQTNQYNAGKQNLEKKIEDSEKKKKKKKTSVGDLVTTSVLNRKIREAENKIPGVTNLVTTSLLETKINIKSD